MSFYPIQPSTPTQTIDVQDIIDDKASKFGSNHTSTDFIQKINNSIWKVLADIEFKLNIQMVINDATNSITFDINGLDRNVVESVLSLGVDYYMQQYGVWTIEDDTTVEPRYRNQLGALFVMFSQNRQGRRKKGLQCRFGELCVPVHVFPDPIEIRINLYQGV